MWYKTFLLKLHEIVSPRRYVEIGIRHGYSLSLSQDAEKIAMDPQYSEEDMEFRVKNAQFFKLISDEFFENHKIENSFDLAYIDGLHLFEYALRDYINLEKYATPGSIIIVDDVIPRNREEALRQATGGPWVGDVWKVVKCFQKYRRDLLDGMYLTGSELTGCLIITQPDPKNSILTDKYDVIMEEFLSDEYPDMPDADFSSLIINPEESLRSIEILCNQESN